MPTDEEDFDDPADLDDSPNVIGLRPWQLIREHGLSQGKQVPMTAEFVRSFHDRFSSALARYSAAPADSDLPMKPSEEVIGFDFERLTDGYFERTSEGVNLVLFGRVAPGETGWLVLGLPFGGGISIQTFIETDPT